MNGPAAQPTALGDHVGWVYDSDEAQLDHYLAFARAGMRDHHRILLLTAALPVATVRERVADEFPGWYVTKRIEVLDGPAMYLRDGQFHREQVTTLFARTIAETVVAGFAGLWVCADMSWAADPVPGAEGIAEYEALANRLYAGGKVAGVCQYDGRRFDRATLDAVCGAHPITPRQAALRFAASPHPPHLVLSGEVDLSNQAALSGVLASLPPGDLEIDATGLRFAAGSAAWAFVGLATGRELATVTVRCRPALARVLSVMASTDRRTGSARLVVTVAQ
jgi:hypothetical protein